MAEKVAPPAAQDGRTICSVCAWRGTCQKKYSFDQSGSAKCPDYTRDLTLSDTDQTAPKGPHES
jgi:hypothetical protein